MKIKKIVSIPKLTLPKISASVPAHLVYNNGPLLSNAQIFTLFWGSYWQQSAGQQMATSINDFFSYILTSTLIDQLSEYSTPQYPIGAGSLLGTGTYVTPKLPFSIFGHTIVSDTAIQNMIQYTIAHFGVPPVGPNNLYCVYLPPGVAVYMGGQFSCITFCGYHEVVNQNLYYAVIPYPCSNCINGLSDFDSITTITSHELCEAITDPFPGSGWYDQNYGEIGDICNGGIKKIGSYSVQREWSNATNACV